MIIRFPTGLYETVLPDNSERGNVTYEISSNSPPKIDLRAAQLPIAERLKPLPGNVFTPEERRFEAAELVFTIVKNGRSNPGSNTKQFETGQSITFSDGLEPLTFLKVPETVELRHDTNLLDLTSVLSSEEIEQLITKSEERKRLLEQQLAQLKVEIKDLEVSVLENQKRINEINKALAAVRRVYDIPINDTTFENEIYQKLLANLDELTSDRDKLRSDHTTKVNEAEQLHQDLFEVSELVR